MLYLTVASYVTSIIVLSAGTAYVVAYLFNNILNKTRILDIVFKRVAAFYRSLPNERFEYAVLLYERKSGKFVDFEMLDENGLSEFDRRKVHEEIKQRLLSQKGDR